MLKNKIKQELETAKQKPPTSEKSTATSLTLNSCSTQTDADDKDLENTLDDLLKNIQDLNKQL
jgi:hypothetical protein